MSDGNQSSQSHPPITAEDLVKLGVESRLIPFIVSTTLWAEQLPSGSPPVSPAEAKNLVEILDKVVSSTTVNPSSKNRCFRVLRKISPSHEILPKSYYLEGATLNGTTPYASGGFADNWQGQHNGNHVCVKAFRTQTAVNLEKIKQRFYREIIGWKYVSHANVLPFLGISETLFSFCIVSPWLQNGNIADYTRKNQGVNRLQLLSQAACGLEYLHSLSIVHSNINPGNILINEDGIASLGDFGIVGVMTDPTVVEPGSTTRSRPGVVRYIAPELLNPLQFGLSHDNPSKESDVYSLAMTAYEALTEVLPYGNTQDGIIIFHVVTGDRPPRPPNIRWLKDQVWDMITACWNEKQELRWDIRAVHNQLSVLSIEEITETEPAKTKLSILEKKHRPDPNTTEEELPQQWFLQPDLSDLADLPVPTGPPLLPQPDGEDDEPRQGSSDHVKRGRKNAKSHSSRGWGRLRAMVRALKVIPSKALCGNRTGGHS